jgi:hypothetical protein
MGTAIAREVRMEGEADEATLATIQLTAEIDEVARRRDARIVVEHADRAAPFHREPAQGITRRLRERDRRGEGQVGKCARYRDSRAGAMQVALLGRSSSPGRRVCRPARRSPSPQPNKGKATPVNPSARIPIPILPALP